MAKSTGTDPTPQIDRKTLRLFWHAGLKYKRLLLTGLLFPAGTILLGVIAPLSIGKCLAEIARPDGNPMQYLIAFMIVASIGVICNRIGHPAIMRHQAEVTGDIQSLALTTLLRRSVGFHTNTVGGKLVSDAVDYATAYGQIANTLSTNVLPFAITLLFGVVVICSESWILGGFIIGMTAGIVGLGVYDSRRMAPLRMERLRASKAVTAHLADTVTNIQTVKTFARESDELADHSKLNRTLTAIRRDQWTLMSTRGNTRIAIVVVLQALFILLTIYAIRRDPSLLGIGIFAFTFTLNLSNRLFEVNLIIRTLEDGLLQASPMTQIIQETPEILDAPSAQPIRVTKGAIDLQHVDFRYHDDTHNQPVFSQLDLHIAPGEKVGLVGPSGGGKTTLTRLLLRFDDLSGGAIAIDGQDIAGITQASLRQAISYVPQEPLLFHRSIRENIAYGRPKAKKKEIEQAARLAHAHEFIDQLSNGYDTIVGERGVKLSGGQRQRIAIARAILKDAPILILDEATSALDSESEILIQKALWKLMEGRTAIVVAHRLSTIQKMDRIIVLDGGRIIEQGTHRQLINRKGLYAKLWSHQSGGFIDD